MKKNYLKKVQEPYPAPAPCGFIAYFINTIFLTLEKFSVLSL